MNDTTPAAPSRRRRFPRRTLLILAIVAAALYGAWWWFAPRPLRAVGHYTTVTDRILSSTAGFLTQSEERVFVLRDWRGTERWRVTVPMPPFYGTDFAYHPTISPDGHRLAIAVTGGPKVYLYRWRDGAALGKPIPLPAPKPVYTRVLNDGRLLVSQEADAYGQYPLYLLIGDHVVARGASAHHGPIAPDGSSLLDIARQTYTQLQVRDSRVIMGRQSGIMAPVINNDSWNNVLCAAGRCLSGDGALYGPKGQINGSNNWRHLEITFDGRFTAQYQENPKRIRAYSPVTGAHWFLSLTRWEEMGWTLASQDGRHVLVAYLPESPISAQKLFEGGYAFIPESMREALAYGLARIEIYERPGRCRVTTNFHYIMRHSRLGTDSAPEMALSPDGHALVINGTREDGSGICTLFRW